MPIVINPLGEAALEMQVYGKLAKDDYQKFIPVLEERINEKGQIGLLLHLSDFQGWTLPALWEDLKFDAKHYNDVSRIALVAHDSGKKWMATLSKPFTGAEIEYFPEIEIDKARAWVQH
ncbi:MAG: STAS/SEC14 domain-containing protein [Myxococcales bacterium]|nr:MAG: STAS/SEC14 domain-containing protein [Myxococcales bacterium]